MTYAKNPQIPESRATTASSKNWVLLRIDTAVQTGKAYAGGLAGLGRSGLCPYKIVSALDIVHGRPEGTPLQNRLRPMAEEGPPPLFS